MEFVMNIILSSVRMATPLIFLALAELYSQRAYSVCKLFHKELR